VLSPQPLSALLYPILLCLHDSPDEVWCHIILNLDSVLFRSMMPFSASAFILVFSLQYMVREHLVEQGSTYQKKGGQGLIRKSFALFSV
jgi:hypothetical protein